MRRVLILFVLALFFTACQKTIRQSYYYYPDQVDLEQYQNLDFIKVKNGKTMTVAVPMSYSTGYHWSTLTENDCAVEVNRGEYKGETSDTPMVGAAGSENWTVSGKQMGSCLVEFVNTTPEGEVTERKGIYFIVE